MFALLQEHQFYCWIIHIIKKKVKWIYVYSNVYINELATLEYESSWMICQKYDINPI